jgi:hypothetical protein
MSDEAGCDSRLTCLTLSAGLAPFLILNDIQAYDKLRKVEFMHNEELNDLYCSPNIVRAMKPRRMRWAGHLWRMGWRGGV